ncbi:hypothetical protein B0H11DRAFT_1726294 [Mycena galericulata]|nr:hypothetical protein B0H11DRAFT_1726294 [Mycena galericulata]
MHETESIVRTHSGKYGSALCAAVRNAHHEIVTTLLDNNVDVNMQHGEINRQCIAGSRRTVRVLLEKGANVDANLGKRGTALQIASRWGHKKIVEILL